MHHVNPNRVLDLGLQGLLQLGQVPLGQFGAHKGADFAEDEIQLSLQRVLDVPLHLDGFLPIFWQYLVEHMDQMIFREVAAISLLQRHPLCQVSMQISGALTFWEVNPKSALCVGHF